MAQYNAWQNANLYGAAEGIGDEARRLDRGAFFGSIHRTLCHLLYADTMWMHRFIGTPMPDRPFAESSTFVGNWRELTARRVRLDQTICDWADGVDQAWLDSTLRWYAASIDSDIAKPAGLTVVHIFNHQIHHRGQVHAMLTMAGARPDVTDVLLMPEAAATPV